MRRLRSRRFWFGLAAPLLRLEVQRVAQLAQAGDLCAQGAAVDGRIQFHGLAQRPQQAEERGATAIEAAVEAARARLRPILMTSFAFILGVLPMATASGPGWELRQALGTAVFFGMIGVTFFGLVFTPVFYVALRSLGGRRDPGTADAPMPAE